jgi:hypothetical protein
MQQHWIKQVRKIELTPTESDKISNNSKKDICSSIHAKQMWMAELIRMERYPDQKL